MSIIIGADLVPTESNYALFENGDCKGLVGEALLEKLNSANYRIFNLEIPLTDKKTPIKKCGPALIAPTKTVEGYKALGVDLLTVANNHIMDQGEEGFKTTLATLEAAGISYVGAGENLRSAQKPFRFDFKGKKIGVYACAEHEFSIADENAPGANPFDALESLDHIIELKKQSDFVIVLYHGGKEHYRYPSPYLQKVCRKIAEKGADLVICQHSHCIGCYEEFNDSTIVYGQGNFLFDHQNNEFWQTSILVSIDESLKVSYIPLEKNGNTVKLATDVKAKEILNAFENRSNEIKIPGVIEKKYGEFAEKMKDHYLLTFSATNRASFIFRVLSKLTGGKYQKKLLSKKYTPTVSLAIENFVDCEAHRELLLFGLKGRKNK